MRITPLSVGGARTFAWAILVAAGVGTASGPAAGVTITYLEDLREIHAVSIARIGGDPSPDNGSATVAPSPPFSDFSRSVQFTHGAASQLSFLRDASLRARGTAIGVEGPNVVAGGGRSTFHVVFAVDETLPWYLDGFLSGSQDFDAAQARITLSSGGTVLFSLALPSIPCCTFPEEPLIMPVSASGELAPGEYELFIEAEAGAGGSGIAEARYDVGFLVPEPSAALLALAALVGLARSGLQENGQAE